MGVAAYNRGTAAIAHQIDESLAATMRPIEFEVMDNLNELPRGNRKLFGETVIRTHSGKFFLMNGQEGGYSRFAYEYSSLRVLFSEWNIFISGLGTDRHSFFYRVVPGGEKGGA